MNIPDFVSLFPDRPLRLTRVERGEAGKRAFGWLAAFSVDYFTSDSDRLVDNHADRGLEFEHRFARGWGDTPEQALDDLLDRLLKSDKAQAEQWRKDVGEVRGRTKEAKCSS